MIVYVESNFVLELAFLRAEHESCQSIIELAEADLIRFVLPAYSVGEPYEAWVRRAKNRRELHARFLQEIKELSRSELMHDAHEITNTLIHSIEDEKRKLDEVLSTILTFAEIVSIGVDIIHAAIDFQNTLNLSPQDSITYASDLHHLASAPPDVKCFLTKNSKDFANPSVIEQLATHDCRLLTRFENGLGYIQSRLRGSS
jgi:predicted nucleic acid-binding protein